MDLPLVIFPKKDINTLIKSLTVRKLTSLIDYTNLKKDAKSSDIVNIAEQAKLLNAAAVCIHAETGLDILAKSLKNSTIKECYVIDFPYGNSSIETKVSQASQIIKKSRDIRNEGKGKIELDMVIDVNKFRKDPLYTLEEIDAVCEASEGEQVKVIIRTSELTVKELYRVSEIFTRSKAHFIKSSTGKDSYGALPEHIRIMREVVGDNRGVKAAGGISDAIKAIKLIYAGANKKELLSPDYFRLGSSSPAAIISSYKNILKNFENWNQENHNPCMICPFYYNKTQSPAQKAESAKWCNNCNHSS